MAQPAASRMSRRQPRTPLATVTPNGSAMSTMTTVMPAVLTASELSRPSAIEVRDTGVARSLSK